MSKKVMISPYIFIDDEDEQIDTTNYTIDIINMIISDNVFKKCEDSENNVHILADAFDSLKNGNFTMFKKIMNKNKNLVNKKYSGSYLIHDACSLGNPEYVALLLFLGANCSILNDKGMTAQHCAVTSGLPVIIDILALFGHSMNITDKNGITPFYYALKSKNEDMIRILMLYKSDPYIKPQTNEIENDITESTSELLDDYIKNFK